MTTSKTDDRARALWEFSEWHKRIVRLYDEDFSDDCYQTIFDALQPAAKVDLEALKLEIIDRHYYRFGWKPSKFEVERFIWIIDHITARGYLQPAPTNKRAVDVADLPEELLSNAKMDERHDHLNALLDAPTSGDASTKCTTDGLEDLEGGCCEGCRKRNGGTSGEAVRLAIQELEMAKNVFAYYAEMHSTKGTAEGNQKAGVNLEHANRIARTITALKAAQGEKL